MKHEANLFLSNNGSHKSALLLKWSKRCRFSVGVWLKDHWCGVFITLSSILKQEVLRLLLLLRPLTWNLIEKRQFLITIKLQADLIWKYSLIPLNTAYAHRIFHCRLTSNFDLKLDRAGHNLCRSALCRVYKAMKWCISGFSKVNDDPF